MPRELNLIFNLAELNPHVTHLDSASDWLNRREGREDPPTGRSLYFLGLRLESRSLREVAGRRRGVQGQCRYRAACPTPPRRAALTCTPSFTVILVRCWLHANIFFRQLNQHAFMVDFKSRAIQKETEDLIPVRKITKVEQVELLFMPFYSFF